MVSDKRAWLIVPLALWRVSGKRTEMQESRTRNAPDEDRDERAALGRSAMKDSRLRIGSCGSEGAKPTHKGQPNRGSTCRRRRPNSRERTGQWERRSSAKPARKPEHTSQPANEVCAKGRSQCRRVVHYANLGDVEVEAYGHRQDREDRHDWAKPSNDVGESHSEVIGQGCQRAARLGVRNHQSSDYRIVKHYPQRDGSNTTMKDAAPHGEPMISDLPGEGDVGVGALVLCMVHRTMPNEANLDLADFGRVAGSTMLNLLLGLWAKLSPPPQVLYHLESVSPHSISYPRPHSALTSTSRMFLRLRAEPLPRQESAPIPPPMPRIRLSSKPGHVLRRELSSMQDLVRLHPALRFRMQGLEVHFCFCPAHPRGCLCAFAQ